MDACYCFQTLILLLSTLFPAQAQFLYDFNTYDRQESALSTISSPMGFYRKFDSYRGLEEYETSIGDAPVAIYGKRNLAPKNPYYMPLPYWNYWPFLFYMYYDPYDSYYSEPMDFHPVVLSPDLFPEHDIEQRNFKGSIAMASSSASFSNGQMKSEAASVQGTITSDAIRGLLDM